MIAAVNNMKSYDWATWAIGILRALTSGGATGVLSAPLSMGIDPEHFNFTNGTGHMLRMMGGMFLGSAIIHLFVFLQTHGAPEKVGDSAT